MMSVLNRVWRIRKALICLLLVFVSLHAIGNAVEQSASDVVWAVNVGGPAYKAHDGAFYQSEASVTGGVPGKILTVLGSDDETLYQSYREGDVRVYEHRSVTQ